jgi:N-carbamoylputrescine amidase
VKDSVRVAAINAASKPGEAKRNLEGMARLAGQAAGAGAELVLFPELSLTGFIPNHPIGDHAAWLREATAGGRRMAEPIDGPSVTALAAIARDTGVHIAAGLLEDAGSLLYNAMVLVAPDGARWAWRKLHVPLFETPFYNGGTSLPVADTALGRIGVNICFDALMPESTRLLAVQNVELVLFPFAADPPPGTAAAWADWARVALRARCAENGVFGVAANYSGDVEFAGARQRFPGGAMVVGPQGEVIAEGAGMLLADLSRETLRDARAAPEYLYRFRRPELYAPLTQA